MMLAACDPGPPEPTPPPTQTAPSPTLPAPDPTFILPPPSGEPVHFTAQGDIGVGTGAKKVLDVIAGLDPQLNLALGDFSYKAGLEDEFCDMVTGKLGADFPYQLITGNHESNGEDGDIEKFVRCLPNKLPGLEGEYGTQWRVDVPEQNPVVRFIMVSPGIDFKNGQPLDYSRGSERWRWTAEAIDQARSEGIPWTVVGMHALCFSVGEKSCQAGKDFTNMLIDKKVDLVLSGHDHIYQRSHQVGFGGRCSELVPAKFSATCMTDKDGDMVQGSGTVFVTVGVGGVGLYNVKNNDPEAGYFSTWSGKNRNPALGTLDVTASAEKLDARFVPAEGHSFTDVFTLQRK
ncbi:3',5'-cyclic AMP phosphodiesterase CpdA [Arthrobacter sp. V4I6]|nr:3',5'-cyclic AMP phosphodiesterase CpdA [Arthrobacter sp. V4I6]